MKTKLFKQTLGGILTAVAVSMTFTNAAILTFTGQTETGQLTELSDNYFWQGCYTPVQIRLNPEGVSTQAVDAKFFLTGTFNLQADTDQFSGFEAGIFEVYQGFGNTLADYRLGTGVSTSGDNIGWDYSYINASNNNTFVNGSAFVHFATFYVVPTGTTGNLSFYYIDPNANFDDSNVASGVDNNTQYVDALNSVLGGGEYVINAGYNCPFKPYIVEWARYESILGTNVPDGLALKDNTNFQNLLGYNVFSPIGPDYLASIIHQAGYDYNTGDYTTANSWDIWTNKPIVITFTGNEYSLNGATVRDIKMVTGTFDSPIISLTSANEWSPSHTITVEGNIQTGISFYNRMGNYGAKYQSGTANYFSEFMIDTFRYDTTPTFVTASVYKTGEGYAFVGLSGENTVGTRSADWTTDDDKFRIIKFSGHNTTNYRFNTTTGYNTLLNDTYVNASGQMFTMNKTGMDDYALLDLLSTQTGAIKFIETRSGRVYYSDIAGNTSGVFVDVIVEPKNEFKIHVTPAFRDAIIANGGTEYGMSGYAMTGDLRLARHDTTNTQRVFTHNSALNPIHPKLRIDNSGTGVINLVTPPAGSEFLVVFKGNGMLAMGFTGIRDRDINLETHRHFYLNNSTLNNSIGISNELFPKLTFEGLDYLTAGDIDYVGTNSYDYVSEADLNTINGSLTVGIDNRPALGGTVPYFYDFDLNRTISAIEQAIVIQFMENRGFISNFTTTANTITNLTLTDFYAAP